MILTISPACSFAWQTTAFSVRGRPKSIFIGVSLSKCPRDEQRRLPESRGVGKVTVSNASEGLRQAEFCGFLLRSSACWLLYLLLGRHSRNAPLATYRLIDQRLGTPGRSSFSENVEALAWGSDDRKYCRGTRVGVYFGQGDKT